MPSRPKFCNVSLGFHVLVHSNPPWNIALIYHVAIRSTFPIARTMFKPVRLFPPAHCDTMCSNNNRGLHQLGFENRTPTGQS